jgi:ethanolamine utilization cobalamin adenosyltransferase
MALATFLIKKINSLEPFTCRLETALALTLALTLALASVVHDVVEDDDRDVVTASGGGVVSELLDEDVALEEGVGSVSELDEIKEADERVDVVDMAEQPALLEGEGM